MDPNPEKRMSFEQILDYITSKIEGGSAALDDAEFDKKIETFISENKMKIKEFKISLAKFLDEKKCDEALKLAENFILDNKKNPSDEKQWWNNNMAFEQISNNLYIYIYIYLGILDL